MTSPDSAADPFVAFKTAQRETWKDFAALEHATTPPAAELVRFAQVHAGDHALDVGCGTGVVAVTAARTGAKVSGLDLTPVLLERARENAAIASVAVEFRAGDVEALPYADATFDVVLSQFGHMFAPRPDVTIAEMLRVLKPGGRIAFSTWPPEHGMGRLFTFVASQAPPPPGMAAPSPPALWGDPTLVRERLTERVRHVRFERGVMRVAALSPEHRLHTMRATLGPLTRLLDSLDDQPARAQTILAELLELVREDFQGNMMHQHYLMTRAVKVA